MLISIDLGKRHCGVAAFTSDKGKLYSAHTVKCDPVIPMAMAAAVVVWAEQQGEPSIYVVEKPQLYRSDRVKHGDLDELLDVLKDIEALVDVPVVTYSPHEWKATVPKDIHHKRILRSLDLAEQTHWHGLDHNGRDAVALGLFRLDRTGRGGLSPLRTPPLDLGLFTEE